MSDAAGPVEAVLARDVALMIDMHVIGRLGVLVRTPVLVYGDRCRCGRWTAYDTGERHCAHVAAALAPLFAEHGAAERWPCDDYKPPLTCYTTPKPRTLICQGCREGFPDGPEVRGLHDAHGAAERRAGAVEFADKLYDALLAKPWTPQWGRDDWKRWLSETSAAALGDRADEAVEG